MAVDISHIDLRHTIGYQLIGGLLSFSFYGITFRQAYVYFARFKAKDSKGLFLLVFSLWVLDSICCGLVANALYDVLVVNWGIPESLSVAPISFVLEYGFTVLITGIAHVFLVRLVWIVSKKVNFVVPIIIFILALTGFASGIAILAIMFKVHRSTTFIESGRYIRILSGINHACSVLADIIITYELCVYLQKDKKRGLGFNVVSSVYDTLVTFFITRGALTTVVQTLTFITYIGIKNQQSWMIWHLLLSKVYVNTLLAIINSPSTIQKRLIRNPTAITLSRIELGNNNVPNTAVTNFTSASRANIIITKKIDYSESTPV